MGEKRGFIPRFCTNILYNLKCGESGMPACNFRGQKSGRDRRKNP